MENGSLIFGNISPLCQEQLYINFAQPQSSHDNINIHYFLFLFLYYYHFPLLFKVIDKLGL